jgi:hypothetical protein
MKLKPTVRSRTQATEFFYLFNITEHETQTENDFRLSLMTSVSVSTSLRWTTGTLGVRFSVGKRTSLFTVVSRCAQRPARLLLPGRYNGLCVNLY